ncbi:MAG: hypothetical protein ACR2P4_09635 [Gammaproteobacteria bacterium]
MTAKAVLPKVLAVRRAPCAVRRGMVINHAENYKPKKARFVKLAKKNPPPCKKTTIARFRHSRLFPSSPLVIPAQAGIQRARKGAPSGL